MHVLMLSDLFPPCGGGAEISAYIESMNMANRGIRISVVTGNNNCSELIEKVSDNFMIFRIPLISQRINENYPFANYLKYRLSSLDIGRIVQRIKKLNPDIMHIQGAEITASQIRKRFKKLRMVVSVRDHWLLCPYRLAYSKNKPCLKCSVELMFNCTIRNQFLCSIRPVDQPLNSFRKSIFYSSFILPHVLLMSSQQKDRKKHLENDVDSIIAISNHIKNIVKNNFNISESAINVIYPPLKNYTIAEKKETGKISFAFIGRLDYSKGILNLIEAFKISLKRHYNIELLIFGDGPLKNYIINQSNSTELRGHITYKGKFDHSLIENTMAIVDIVIVPSLSS